IPVTVGDSADAEDRCPPAVGDDAIARLNRAEHPNLVRPRAALVLVVLGLRARLEVALGEPGDVAKVRPADGGDASLPPLGPRDAVPTGSDLPVASARR